MPLYDGRGTFHKNSSHASIGYPIASLSDPLRFRLWIVPQTGLIWLVLLPRRLAISFGKIPCAARPQSRARSREIGLRLWDRDRSHLHAISRPRGLHAALTEIVESRRSWGFRQPGGSTPASHSGSPALLGVD